MAPRKIVVVRLPEGVGNLYVHCDIWEDKSNEEYLVVDDHVLGFPIEIPRDMIVRVEE